MDITEMKSEDLFHKMTTKQRDDIYRMVWYDNVCDDVLGFLEDYNGDIPETQIEIDKLVRNVANDFVYNGDYDCNLDYWRNIENLVEKYL